MFYESSISPSHAEQKEPFIKDIIETAVNSYNVSNLVILGAQFNVKPIVEFAVNIGVNPIVVEYRKEEADKWNGILSKENIINKDADLLDFHKLINCNSIVYDNLSGGSTRIDRWKRIIDSNSILIAYVHNRGGVLGKAIEMMKNKVRHIGVSSTANLLVYAPWIKEYSKEFAYVVNKGYNRRKHDLSYLAGHYCPRCGNESRGMFISRKTGLVHCCKNKYFASTCRSTFDKKYLRPYGNMEFRAMIKWCFGE